MPSPKLTFDQIVEAVQKLPRGQKQKLLRIINIEDGSEEARHRLRAMLEDIRIAGKDLTEEEVAADVEAAIREVREARRSKGGR